MLDPRVFGTTLDRVAKKRVAARGASFPTLHNELNGFCTTQIGRPHLTIREKVGYPVKCVLLLMVK